MPRTHQLSPDHKAAVQELLALQRYAQELSSRLEQLERATIPAPPPPSHRPIATLQAITIDGVQQPYFTSHESCFGPFSFDDEKVQQDFLDQCAKLQAPDKEGRPLTDDDRATPPEIASHAASNNLMVVEQVTRWYALQAAMGC